MSKSLFCKQVGLEVLSKETEEFILDERTEQSFSLHESVCVYVCVFTSEKEGYMG